MKYKKSKNSGFRGLHEWHRTIILFVLLGIGVGVMIWTNTNVSNNFVDQFQEPPEAGPAEQIANPVEIEETLEDFVRQTYVINGRIDGFEDRFNNVSFVVNATTEQDYSVLELPDNGEQQQYVVTGTKMYVNGGGAWDPAVELEGNALGFGATRFTPTNKEVNEAWRQTLLQPDAKECSTGSCAQWLGEGDDGAETELLLSQDGRIVRLRNKSASGVEVLFDYSYSTPPTVISVPNTP